MRKRADKEGVDLLVIDTGDRIEGNGLYDASDPKGRYTFDIIKHQHIDVLCSGNHELYKANASNNEYFQTEPNFKGNYLASNLDIHDSKTGELVPLAPRYKKFTTKNQGIRIIAFGFMFNFQGSSNNTVVTPVQDAIKQKWFQDAIRDRDIDLFLVIGHIGLRMEEFKMIFEAIRAQRWDAPIHFFGGHTHIRDYAKYDSQAYALESGRYMETIGFASVSGLATSKKGGVELARKSPSFARRYIDNNLFSYYHHTGLNETTFPTELGTNVTKQIARARKELDLDSIHGCAPRDLWLNRAALRDEASIFRWLGEEVFPDSFSEYTKDATPKLVITNTGAIRFDIFKGPFTRDSSFQVTPFTTGFRAIKYVNYKIASRVLDLLNSNAPVLQELDPSLDALAIAPPVSWAQESFINDPQEPLKHDKPPSPGYTTKDDAGTDGDDTIHSPIEYFQVPNCIQTEVDYLEKDEPPKSVDLIYNEFLEPWVILALKFLGQSYDKKDTLSFMDGKSLTDIIADWVEEHWECEIEGNVVDDEL